VRSRFDSNGAKQTLLVSDWTAGVALDIYIEMVCVGKRYVKRCSICVELNRDALEDI
jgi:hypothetical protein